jgi:hypothetical protein
MTQRNSRAEAFRSLTSAVSRDVFITLSLRQKPSAYSRNNEKVRRPLGYLTFCVSIV